jgi:hypothetical protein
VALFFGSYSNYLGGNMKTKTGILVAIILVISLAISGCAPGQAFGPTFTPTPTATQTPTMTPTPTETPMPTATVEACSDFGGDIITLPATDLTGTLDQKKCNDVWVFTKPTGTKIQVTMHGTTPNIWPDFSLWTTANDTCADCADMTLLTKSEDLVTVASLTYTLPYAGDYYLMVGSASEVPSGSYTLSIETVTEAPAATRVPVQSTKAAAEPTKVSAEPTQQPTHDSSDGGEGGTNLGGGVPVTITNQGSHDVKVEGIGPVTYTVKVGPGESKMVYWVSGQYTFDIYKDGSFAGSTSGLVNEEHGMLTIY